MYFSAADTTIDDYRFSSFRSLSIVRPKRRPIKVAPHIPTGRHFHWLFTIYNIQNALSTAPRSSIPTSISVPTAPSGALSHQPHSARKFLHSGRNDDVAAIRSRSRSRRQARAASATARSPASPMATFLSRLSLFCFFCSSLSYSSKDFLTVSKDFFLSSD